MQPLSGLSVDELADGICARAGRIAAAQAELLVWIAEFDRREGWAGPGMLSCAHWLSWRTCMSPGAAREQVRVARRLEELPAVAEAFRAGRVSYSQARAITRVAQPDDGIDWPELARHASGAQIEKIVRGVRRAQVADEAAADPEQAEWKVRTRKRYDDDGNLVMTIYAKAEYAPVIEAGIEAKRAEIDRERSCGEPVPAGTPDGVPTRATDGDALLALAQEALADEKEAHPDAARRRRPQLTPQVDPLSGWARQVDGELLPPSSMKQVLKSLPGRDAQLALRPVTAADLRRYDLGRAQRLVSDALRTLLGTLDGERCRFPGCTRHKKLHAHHVVYWRDGGPTDLSNLVLVCARHHTLIHALGFSLVLHPDRRLEVHTADGVPVLHHPAQPWGDPAELDPLGRVSAGTLPPDHCDARLDLRYVVSVLVAQAA
ncbi:MAG: endonuclease [Frankiales bacterium]|nr:endonuclease [Frankiales bacterium]